MCVEEEGRLLSVVFTVLVGLVKKFVLALMPSIFGCCLLFVIVAASHGELYFLKVIDNNDNPLRPFCPHQHRFFSFRKHIPLFAFILSKLISPSVGSSFK